MIEIATRQRAQEGNRVSDIIRRAHFRHFDFGQAIQVTEDRLHLRSGHRVIQRRLRVAREAIHRRRVAKSALGAEAIRAQPVGSGRRLHEDALHFRHRRNVEAGQSRPCQQAGVRVAIAAVIHRHAVHIATAIQGQQPGDLIDQQVIAAHENRVVPGSCVDAGVAANGFHRHGIGARAGRDDCRALVRGFNRQRVVARAELEAERFEVEILDAAANQLAADERVATHAKTGEAIFRQHTLVVRRTLAVEHVERIDLRGLGDPRIQVDRRVEVSVAHDRRQRITSLSILGPRQEQHDGVARNARLELRVNL